MDLSNKAIPRQVNGNTPRLTADQAMERRAADGQSRADEPPTEPVGYNIDNPEPGTVYYETSGGRVRSRKK